MVVGECIDVCDKPHDYPSFYAITTAAVKFSPLKRGIRADGCWDGLVRLRDLMAASSLLFVLFFAFKPEHIYGCKTVRVEADFDRYCVCST